MLTRHVRFSTLGGFAKGLFLVLHPNIAVLRLIICFVLHLNIAVESNVLSIDFMQFYTKLVRRRNTSRKAARKASVEARRLVPSDCAVWVRSWHTKDGDTAFSRFVLLTARLPFVACNELAIATKSIASVLPHAERTPWVPSKYAEGERR